MKNVCIYSVTVIKKPVPAFKISCGATFCGKSLILSVECSVSTEPVNVVCFFDDLRGIFEPCEMAHDASWYACEMHLTRNASPGGLEFELDVTDYTPGPHRIVIVASDPETNSRSQDIITFITPQPEGV